MRLKICFFILLAVGLHQQTTAQQWAWGKIIGIDYSNFPAIYTDPAGNSYASYDEMGTRTLSKHDFAGNLVYQKTISARSFEVGHKLVATDTDGNLVFILTSQGNAPCWVEIDSLHYNTDPQCTADFLLVKCDVFGNILWATAGADSLNPVGAKSLAVDRAGNIYVMGSTRGATFNGLTITSSFGNGIVEFLIKYNPNGDVIWIKTLRDRLTTQLGGMLTLFTDQNDEVVVSGYYRDSTTFLNTRLVSSPSPFASFMAKIDTSGSLLWVKNYADNGAFVAGVDADNNLYTYTHFLDSAYVDGNLFTSSLEYSSGVLGKFDSSGNLKWTRQLYPSSNNLLIGNDDNLHVSEQGNFYLALPYIPRDTALIVNNVVYHGIQGALQYKLFIVKLDSAGNTVYVNTDTLVGYNNPGMHTDRADNLYFHTNFSTDAVLGNDTLADPGGADPLAAIVARYGAASPYTSISGKAYLDVNDNCQREVTDSGIAGVGIKVTPGNYAAMTNASGDFQIALPPGTYQVNADYTPRGIATQCPFANQYTITVNSSSAVNNLDFSFRGYAIIGTVYIDSNQNCMQEVTDEKAANVLIKITPGPVYCSSDQNGNFFAQVDPGSYTVTQVSKPNAYSYVSCPSSGNYMITVDSINNIAGSLDFGNTIIPSVQDLQMTLSFTGAFNPARGVKLYLTYTNAGTISMDGYVMLRYDSVLVYQLASQPFDQHTNNELRWNYTALTPGESRTITADFGIQPPPFTMPGMFTQHVATIYPLSQDTTASDNADTLWAPIRTAYDPNMKEAIPAADLNGNIDIATDTMIYTVHFQNTGNDTAYNIWLRDTIQENFQVETFKLLAASHECVFEVRDEGIINFYFENILLPDSNTNEPASHGFIKYSIAPDTLLTEGAQLKNAASIYFDYNDPIKTNEVVSTLKIPVGIGNINANTNPLVTSVYPNPSSSDFTIEYALSQSAFMQVEVVNLLGVTVKNLWSANRPAGDHKATFSIKEPGVYFLKITAGKESRVLKVMKID